MAKNTFLQGVNLTNKALNTMQSYFPAVGSYVYGQKNTLTVNTKHSGRKV